MSGLLELQQEIADICNADETLVQGGCKAFAEDIGDLYQQIAQALEVGKLSVVVATPNASSAGRGKRGGVVMLVDPLMVSVTETPMLSRVAPGMLTALQAAQHIMLMLDQDTFRFARMEQVASPSTDSMTETITVNLFFKTSVEVTGITPTTTTEEIPL